MAGGPLGYESAGPGTSGELFPYVYRTAGGSDIEGLGCAAAADISADRTYTLIFQMPEVLPSGTPKLRIRSFANASSGNIVVNPTWRAADPSGFDPDVAGTAEGNQTITFTAVDEWVETKVELNATTVPAAGQTLQVDLIFVDASITVTAISVHLVDVIWE